jgi:hypothetical protein
MKPTVPETLPGAAKVAGVLRVFGYALVILGLFSMAGARGRVRAARERTEFPVKLQAGQEYRAPIKTSAKAELIIELRVNRHEGVPDDLLDEVLVGETNRVHIDWRITQSGTTHAAGSSTNARKHFTGSAAARTKGIGNFKPPQAGVYEFAANIRTDLPELERARPHIVIRPTSAFMLNASIAGSAGMFGGGLLALLGLILILLARRERNTSAATG